MAEKEIPPNKDRKFKDLNKELFKLNLDKNPLSPEGKDGFNIEPRDDSTRELISPLLQRFFTDPVDPPIIFEGGLYPRIEIPIQNKEKFNQETNGGIELLKINKKNGDLLSGFITIPDLVNNDTEPTPLFDFTKLSAEFRIGQIRETVEQVKEKLSTKPLYEAFLAGDLFRPESVNSFYLDASGSDAYQMMAEGKRVDTFRLAYQEKMAQLFGIDVSSVSWTPVADLINSEPIRFQNVRDALYQYYRVQEALVEDPTQQAVEYSNFPTQDTSRNIINSPIDVVIQEIARSPDATQAYLEMVDEYAMQHTQEELDFIDRTSGRVRKKVVIVGADPAATTLLRQLAPEVDVTVITKDIGLGYPNRARRNFLNSSSDITDPNEIPLPFLPNSSTTPVMPQGVVDGVYTTPQGPVKRINCDDGSTKTYKLLAKLGEQCAMNISMYTTDILVGQTVLANRTRQRNGRVEITIRDEFDGKERIIEADTVIFATGTPAERFSIGKKILNADGTQDFGIDEAGKNLYIQSKNRLRSVLMGLVEFKRSDPQGFQIYLDNAQEYIRLQREAGNNRYGFFSYLAEKNSQYALPRLLSREMFETADTIWNLTGGPVVRPEFNPLHELYFARTIGIIGYKDTGRANGAERFVDAFREEGTSRFINPGGLEQAPQLIIYGKKGTSQAELGQGERPRYRNSSGDRAFGRDERVTSVRQKQKRILVTTNSGTYSHDYVFLANGLNNSKISDEFPFQFTSLIDTTSGIPIARVNARQNVYITGVAAKFADSEFAPEQQTIFNALRNDQLEGGTNNRVALWLIQQKNESTGWSICSEVAQQIARDSFIPSHMRQYNQLERLQLKIQATGKYPTQEQ